MNKTEYKEAHLNRGHIYAGRGAGFFHSSKELSEKKGQRASAFLLFELFEVMQGTENS